MIVVFKITQLIVDSGYIFSWSKEQEDLKDQKIIKLSSLVETYNIRIVKYVLKFKY